MLEKNFDNIHPEVNSCPFIIQLEKPRSSLQRRLKHAKGGPHRHTHTCINAIAYDYFHLSKGSMCMWARERECVRLNCHVETESD